MSAPRDKGPTIQILTGIISLIVAAAGAWSMQDRIRTVDIVKLFAGGMGAGASLFATITKLRSTRTPPAT